MTDPAYDLVVRSGRVLTPDGERPASVAVRGGTIEALTDYREPPSAVRVVDLGTVPLLPGLVDTHVHVNEPGRTAWEGFATATAAAAAGGVTTIVDMPLNSLPPTTTARALQVKRLAAAGHCAVDVGFWGGAVPGNVTGPAEEFHRLHAAGVFGFKCFLSDSGVPEFPALDDAQLRAAMSRLAALDALLIVHAEDDTQLGGCSGADFAGFAASRPPAAELHAVRRVIAAARATGCRAHIVHLSAADCVPDLVAARADGVRITAETCPHYLYFAAEEVPDGDTAFKSCPPIRDAAGRDALWAALSAGAIDCVVSDHSPCPVELKRRGRADPGTAGRVAAEAAGHPRGDFGAAWGGIASLQVGLSAVWTAASGRGIPLADVVAWMSAGPAGLVGLREKGAIAPGRDADLVAFDPDDTFQVHPDHLAHRNPVCPYAGRTLRGVVRGSWLRGVAVSPGAVGGELLSRS